MNFQTKENPSQSMKMFGGCLGMIAILLIVLVALMVVGFIGYIGLYAITHW